MKFQKISLMVLLLIPVLTQTNDKKNALRRLISATVIALPIEERATLSKILCRKAAELPQYKDTKTIAFYHPDGIENSHEVDVLPLINHAFSERKRVCLPTVEETSLVFKEITSFADIVKGAFGILAPKKDCKTVRPHLIGLMFVPAVAADKQGHRLGRGGGFYDRYLERSPIRQTACLLYDEQLMEKVPYEKHDQSMDIIITPTETIVPLPSLQKLLNGNKSSYRVQQRLTRIVRNNPSLRPRLDIILVGYNAASRSYVFKKKKSGEAIGIETNVIHFTSDTPQQKVIETIQKLNNDSSVHGILVQLPLPKHIKEDIVLNCVAAHKDVDGLGDDNMKALARGDEGFECCTPAGIMELLKASGTPLAGKNVALVGYGQLVGEPLYPLLLKKNLNVTVYSRRNPFTHAESQKADIIISAVGVGHLITPKHVKPGALIIDAGVSRLNGKNVGDVNFDAVFKKAGQITPSPGGVEPMTVAMLLKNVVTAAQRAQRDSARLSAIESVDPQPPGHTQA